MKNKIKKEKVMQHKTDITKNYYVVICDNNLPYKYQISGDPDGAIVGETYLRHASLKEAKRRAKTVAHFGKTYIAKLQFVTT